MGSSVRGFSVELGDISKGSRGQWKVCPCRLHGGVPVGVSGKGDVLGLGGVSGLGAVFGLGASWD